ncbi:MAG TPA: hypothetical protein VFC63_08350 [Blastocatellia bacterium]|nr:hypothetical protein [Blastocatellia bacterium]
MGIVMDEDNNIALDEERRLASHQDVKASIDSDVNERIKRQAERVEPAEAPDLTSVAAELKEKSVRNAIVTERELERGKVAARVSQVIDYIFYIIYGIIALQFMLRLMGAYRGNEFVKFVAAISHPLTGPFEGIVATPTSGAYQIEISYLIALVVYILIHLAINGALRLMAHRKVSV